MVVIYTKLHCSLNPIHQFAATTVHISCWPELSFRFKVVFQKLKTRNLRFIQVKQLVI